ncbi:conserved hypothetical protein [Burkholderia vietnamiensis]|nr:conserved hypothetical protein [Burkholderia vietnamiensis]
MRSSATRNPRGRAKKHKWRASLYDNFASDRPRRDAVRKLKEWSYEKTASRTCTATFAGRRQP